MVSIFDQALQMTGKVLGHILDWPFLLFVLVVWILVRYRDQIDNVLGQSTDLLPGLAGVEAQYREGGAV